MAREGVIVSCLVIAVVSLSFAEGPANAQSIPPETQGSMPFRVVGPDPSTFQDIFTVEGELITANDQRQDFSAAMERLGPKAGPSNKPLPVVEYDDGTVGIGIPVPLVRQEAGPVVPSAGDSKAASGPSDLARAAAIAASSTPVFTQEAVFGNDDRSRATPTYYYPRNAIGKLRAGDGATCSGVLYWTAKVVTAAHCLYDTGRNAWRPGPWYFEPAQDGVIHNLPECQMTNAAILSSYRTSDRPENDLGMVALNCNYPGSIGNGYYPLVALSAYPQTFRDGLYIVGYPVNARGSYVLGQQWEHSGRLIYDQSFLKTLNVDSSGGQSGGLWAVPCQEFGWYYCMVGPHFGRADFFYGGMNVAHQFTSSDITILANF